MEANEAVAFVSIVASTLFTSKLVIFNVLPFTFHSLAQYLERSNTILNGSIPGQGANANPLGSNLKRKTRFSYLSTISFSLLNVYTLSEHDTVYLHRTLWRVMSKNVCQVERVSEIIMEAK